MEMVVVMVVAMVVAMAVVVVVHFALSAGWASVVVSVSVLVVGGALVH